MIAKTLNTMNDSVENKELLYGRYEDQVEAISIITKALDNLKMRAHGQHISDASKVDYTVLALKLARSVVVDGDSAPDSWLDLANYARLAGRRRTGIDILDDLKKIPSATKKVPAYDKARYLFTINETKDGLEYESLTLHRFSKEEVGQASDIYLLNWYQEGNGEPSVVFGTQGVRFTNGTEAVIEFREVTEAEWDVLEKFI